VPFFGDIPVLGYLFKNRRTAQAKQELLVFITPKMLDHSAVAR
jgi:type IV pilus assembly protein PilQ